MGNQYDNFNDEYAESINLSDLDISETLDAWELNDFDDLLPRGLIL